MYRWLRTETRSFRWLVVVALAAAAAGCASSKVAKEASHAVEHRNYDAAVYYYLQAVAQEPENVQYRLELIRARQRAAQEHFKLGTTFKQLGNLAAARQELLLASQLDPTHEFAIQELEEVQQDLDVLARPDGVHELEELKRRARDAKVKPPVLDPKSKEPITLNFPQPKPVKEIYQAMAKAYGFNVLFDPKLKDDRLSIELTDVTAERSLELVMQHAGHFYKVLDEHTIIIAEDNPQNRRDYEDLVIKTFFLSNADVKEVDKLLRSLIEARRLSTNEQLNAITLRDTADKVAIAEKLISTTDKAKAEVLVDVELLEVNSTFNKQLGTAFSTYSFPIVFDNTRVANEAPTAANSLYLPNLSDAFTSSAWSTVVPNVTINLIKSTTDATSLAQPQMRITEGEKGSLIIGERRPIPVTSFNTRTTSGGDIIPITSYQYQDVGIKIDVEPRVHHNREITLKVTVEVSSVTGEVQGSGGANQPIIGTRTINTVIRLQDGETNMLVGLYKEDTSSGTTETPGLSDIPLLGRLFTNKTRSKARTDLVLTLTPHIVRFPDITEEDLAPVWVGTESRISYFGSGPRVHSGRADEGPFDRSPVRPGMTEPSGGGESEKGESEQRPSPFHIRGGGRATPRGDGGGGGAEDTGIDLTPSSGLSSKSAPAVPIVRDPEDGFVAWPEGLEQPVTVGLEPSVLTLKPGQQAKLQLVVSGGVAAYRLPLGMSFDPGRLSVDWVEPAEGVEMLDGRADADMGFVIIDLWVVGGTSTPQSVATLTVTAIGEGPVPLAFTANGAVTEDGTVLPLVANDGAVFVNGGS